MVKEVNRMQSVFSVSRRVNPKSGRNLCVQKEGTQTVTGKGLGASNIISDLNLKLS